MRILLDQVVHHHRNKGNNALLEVTLKRLREFWPEASYAVVSIAPHLCKTYIPGDYPVNPEQFEKYESQFDILYRLVPHRLWRLSFELREMVHGRTGLLISPGRVRALMRPNRDQQTVKAIDANEQVLLESVPDETETTEVELYGNIANYDLYIATGGGYLCDADKRFLMPFFDKLETAVAHRVPTVLVGQGVGPIEDAELFNRAKEVLPQVDYILIREEQLARPLLDSLAVDPGKVIMTGDDAIELAYEARSQKPGMGIGLSLRIASYTEVHEEHIEKVRPILHNKAQKYGAELIAAPIDVNDADIHYIEELMKGYKKTSSNWQKFELPLELIKRISRCRIMISGTYHGAVFALSQGIPVIALANSVYHTAKVVGLATEFGEKACQVITLDDADLENKLSEAIEQAWASADALRPQLLAQAKRQIDLGQAAYQKIFELVETRRQEKAAMPAAYRAFS